MRREPDHDDVDLTAPNSRLIIRGGLAAIDRVPLPALADALTSIPGNALSATGMEWAVRIGPDRAYSLARITDAFELTSDPESRRQLAELIKRRDVSTIVIELVEPDGPWLSLLDDWASLGIEELRAIPGARACPEAGRAEVPLTPWTSEAIRACVRTHALRLSPSAQLAVNETLRPSGGRAGEHGESRGDRRPGVSMDASGRSLVLSAGGQPALMNAVARLPDARAVGRTGRWFVPATPQAARAVRTLLGVHPELAMDATSTRWLEEAPRWIARVDVRAADGAARLMITTRWGDPPSELAQLEHATTATAVHSAPLTPANLQLLANLRQAERELTLSPSTDRALRWVQEHPSEEVVPPAELDLVDEGAIQRFVVEPIWDDNVEPAFFALEADVLRHHRREHPHDGYLPADDWPTDRLARFVRLRNLYTTARAAGFLAGALRHQADAQRLISMSKASAADIEIDGLGGELMPFQRAGVVYALERRRVFLADEQGLGKTIQALATVQADVAYPAVVVCPASLKLNWLREARRWLPDRRAVAIAGRAERELDGAELVVVNYEIVGAHTPAIEALQPRALILDEAHYIKSPKALRTRSVLELAGRLGPDALRLALTGTPVVNRPAELAPQLCVLGRLGEFGSARSFERGYSSGKSRRRLHERLRSSCYLRRRKEDVLEQLPDKRRAVVAIPLDNERDYRLAEDDFIRWLREQIERTGSGSLPDSQRAAALVRLTALRRLAARGKLHAALSWIEDFSQSDERLVVFAHHREIQEAVIERFPDCSRIVGTDPIEAREANVQAFQESDGPAICVCSLEVASHGFTLTAAANVAFLELAWTPAKHDQAEDRLHRIGQQRAVTAWYLLAAETIDERIANLLEEKRHLVDSITDGGEETSSTLITELIRGYASTGSRNRTDHERISSVDLGFGGHAGGFSAKPADHT